MLCSDNHAVEEPHGASSEVRVMIVARVRFYRDGLARALASNDSIALVGQFTDWREAVPLIAARRPHVVLVDVHPGADLDAIRRLATVASSVRVVALAVQEPELNVLPLAEAGIAGYVTS